MHKVRDKITLFTDKADCCGCGACAAVCPKHAISLVPDENGFQYPEIDEAACISCGKCLKVCNYKSDDHRNRIGKVYAATAEHPEIAMKSASGGIFAELAGLILDRGGYVFGSAFCLKDGKLEAVHICVESRDELSRLQGSKYLQSDMLSAYSEARTLLQQGSIVLFSGTPCQIVGLKSFLGKDYDNLFTVDIICHGVPSQQMFQDYTSLLMEKYQGDLQSFKFRDKAKGWGLNASVTYSDRSHKIRTKYIPFRASSYYDMFIKCETYRENCYSCPFANESRTGDLTLGDFWGIQRVHPEYMTQNGGPFHEERGISCILENTEKGRYLLEESKNHLVLRDSSFQNAAAENSQLQHPSSRPDSRETVMQIYREAGYAGVEKYFNKRIGIKKYYYILKNMIPQDLKIRIKQLIKR